MSVKVKQYSVNTGSKIFYPGDIVTGLSEEEERQLVKEGVLEWSHDGQADDIGVQLPLTVDLPSAKEFADLTAEEQKVQLDTLGISPESNKDERVKQYTEWLAANDAK